MNRERQIIDLIKTTFGDSSAELIGDDCAVLELKDYASFGEESSEKLLVSTDAMVEGIHFLSGMEPYYLGWKAIAVNLSDIAAMGGIAKHFFLSASLPAQCTEDYWLKEFVRGIFECCYEHKVKLAGGDLTAADKVYLSGTVLGCTQNGKVAKRSFARPSQVVAVTASSNKTFGESAAGLWALQNGFEQQFPRCILSHQKPYPRLSEGLALVQKASSSIAMMDVSDGLLDCLQQIAEQSKVKLKIDLNCLPLSVELMTCAKQAGIKPEQWILTGGEDYELVACCDAADLNQDWMVIGEVLDGPVSVEITNEKKLIDVEALKSFDHFC